MSGEQSGAGNNRRREQLSVSATISRNSDYTATSKIATYQNSAALIMSILKNGHIIENNFSVQSLIKRGENYIAAQLLIRISTNISQFPIHAVPILTSTVVTCTKAGLKASAFKFASLLLQPTYRHKIDEKYKRKIETVVRKSDRNSTDVEVKRTPCPMCQAPVEEFNLSCSECKSNIPYCVVTGKHVTSSDFAMCPSCSFPGFFSEFNKLANLREKCPMCYEKVDGVVPADYNESRKLLQDSK